MYNFKRCHIFLQGEYRIKFLGILRCSSIQSNEKIQFDYYLNTTSTNTTEFKGNLTYLEPFDDSHVSIVIIIII